MKIKDDKRQQEHNKQIEKEILDRQKKLKYSNKYQRALLRKEIAKLEHEIII